MFQAICRLADSNLLCLATTSRSNNNNNCGGLCEKAWLATFSRELNESMDAVGMGTARLVVAPVVEKRSMVALCLW
jgi:hypothetical protein